MNENDDTYLWENDAITYRPAVFVPEQEVVVSAANESWQNGFPALEGYSHPGDFHVITFLEHNFVALDEFCWRNMYLVHYVAHLYH